MLQMEILLHQYSAFCVDQQIGYFLIQKRGEELLTAPLKDFNTLSQNGPVVSSPSSNFYHVNHRHAFENNCYSFWFR